MSPREIIRRFHPAVTCTLDPSAISLSSEYEHYCIESEHFVQTKTITFNEYQTNKQTTYSMDQVKNQLKLFRNKLDQIPALDKAEVSH